MAVWPSPDVVNALAGLDRPACDGVRWTTPDQWHVTLRFLGWMVDAEEGKGALARTPFVREAGQVMAVAGPAISRLGPSILCVPARPLGKLKTLVQDLAVGAALLPLTGHHHDPDLAETMLWLAVVLTLLSGAQYLVDGRRSRLVDASGPSGPSRLTTPPNPAGA